MNEITLSPDIQQHLTKIIEREPEPIARRARLILAYGDGLQTFRAASMAGLSRGRARYWKREFLLKGMSIFKSTPESLDVSPEKEGLDELPVVEEGNKTETKIVLPELELDFGKKHKHLEKKNKKLVIPDLPWPEPVRSAGLLADDPLSEAGRKIFLAQFAELLNHESGTRSGEDIESLHDMRVASRRIRAAFDVFGEAFNHKALKQHLAGFRQLGRLLGSVRDLDVFMEKADRYLVSVPEELKQGLNPLLSAWQSQLVEARNRLVVHLDSTGYREFKQYFNYFIQTPGLGNRRVAGDTPVPQRVCEIAPCLIYTRLAEVRAYTSVVGTASIPQLHALRIEFKKLRYALEFLSEVLGSEAIQVIDLIKMLQDHLGDLHDADVACQILNSFLENWDRSQNGLQLTELHNPEPIVNYLAYQYAERHRLLVTFPQEWVNFDNPETMRKVALAISVL